MSTRSSILIEIPDKYIGQSLMYYPTKSEDNWGNNTIDDMSQKVTITKKYLGIYCHHDGYPDGVGRELANNYNDFQKAFNLILGGDCSSIFSNCLLRYATREGEKWEHIQPRQLDRIEKVSSDSEYLYIFMHGRWYLFENNCFIPLLKNLDSYDDYVQGYLDGYEDGESFNQTLRQLDLDKLENE